MQYILAQLAGATLAALGVPVLLSRPRPSTPPSSAFRCRASMPGAEGAWVTVPILLGVEFVLTFLLMTAIFGTAVDERGKAVKIGGFGIGLTVTFDILACGAVTGASMNPARSFGPALIYKLTGGERRRGAFDFHWCYWVAPIAGAVVAALIYEKLILGNDRRWVDLWSSWSCWWRSPSWRTSTCCGDGRSAPAEKRRTPTGRRRRTMQARRGRRAPSEEPAEAAGRGQGREATVADAGRQPSVLDRRRSRRRAGVDAEAAAEARRPTVTGHGRSPSMLPDRNGQARRPVAHRRHPRRRADLTIDEIDKWLADPKNHVVLKPELPLGLAAGAAEIKGLDENPLTRAKIELGRQLYFDQRLSADVSISCASCHDPDAGYASHTRFGVGVRQARRAIATRRSAYNRILSAAQFWDGRAPTLEEQAKGPIANPIEMSNTHEACVACLKKVPGYVRAVREDLRRRPEHRQRRQAIASLRAGARHRSGAVGRSPGAEGVSRPPAPPTSKTSTRSRKTTPSCTTSTWR